MLLLHDNKGIKDKFTPHTPYPAIVCLLGGPRVTRICHFNLLTSRGDKGIQFEPQCKLMKLRVHEMNILACYHLQTRSFQQRDVSTSALYPCSFIPSSFRVNIITLQSKLLNRIHTESTFQHKHDCRLDREVGFKEEILKTHCFGGELNCEPSQQWNNGG